MSPPGAIQNGPAAGVGHPRWVRLAHWLGAASVLTLAVTGFVILMAHPRLYWGETGNDLTPPLIELPVSRNYKHGGWQLSTPSFPDGGSAVSSVRTYDILNLNSWGRSLHFLAAWFLVVTGLVYLLAGIAGGHLRRDLLPRARELAPRALWTDLIAHLRQVPPAHGGPPYNLLQKVSYSLVLFLAVPLMFITGLAQSPAINAAYPFLAGMFGGTQSARTVHFLVFAVLVVFVIIHVVMVILSGFRRQIRAMTLGRPA
jgi:thiosulfate reductase cytochrome b subunit